MTTDSEELLRFLKHLNGQPLLKEQLLTFLDKKLNTYTNSMLMQKEVENVFRDQGKAQAIKEILHTFERRLEN